MLAAAEEASRGSDSTLLAAQVADDDLRMLLSGLVHVVQGFAAFRTHASSAHGQEAYKMEPRHSRLVVHAADTVALFLLETWEERTAVR